MALDSTGIEGFPTKAPARGKHNFSSVSVDEQGGFGLPENVASSQEELEVPLGDIDSLDTIQTAAEDVLFDELERQGVSLEHVTKVNAYKDLLHLNQVMRTVREKIEANQEVTDIDGEEVQKAYSALVEATENLTMESFESAGFDPEEYINKQFGEHQYLRHSQTTPVILLLEQYKAAYELGKYSDAEDLAYRIKAHVDELVGNDYISEEGVGVDLSTKKESVQFELVPQDLNDTEETVEIKLKPTATPGVDFSQSSIHSPELQADLKDSWTVTDNLEQVAKEKARQMAGHEVRTVTIDDAAYAQPEAGKQNKPEKHYTDEELISELYGMRVPDENSPVYAVASFREGLKIAIRHDQDLQEMPDKQQLFTELVELLDGVSDNDLNEEVAKQLQLLVRNINTPEAAMETATPEKLVLTQEMKVQEGEKASVESSPEPTSAEQLQADLAEYGQTSLEPDLADEVMVEEPVPVPVSFTPSSISGNIAESVPGDFEGNKEFVKLRKKFISSVESLPEPSFVSRIVNGEPSPFSKLADRNFDELFDRAAGAGRQDLYSELKNLEVDHNAFMNWEKTAEKIRDTIDTQGKTFLEVVDELVYIDIKLGNTQPN